MHEDVGLAGEIEQFDGGVMPGLRKDDAIDGAADQVVDRLAFGISGSQSALMMTQR